MSSWRVDAVGAAACVAITAAGFFAVAQPIITQRLEKAKLLDEVDEQRRQTAALRQTDKVLHDQRDRLRERLASGELELQPPTYLNTRMALIVELASATGIIINETKSGTISAGQLYQTVPITLTGSGSYPDCAAYLHELHEILPDTGVIYFELSGNPNGGNTTGLFRFSLVWFAAPMGAMGEPGPPLGIEHGQLAHGQTSLPMPPTGR